MNAAPRARRPAWRYRELAADLGVPLRENEPMARHTTLGVGGPADWFFEPQTPEIAARLWAELRRGPLPVRPLGAGSNLVVADEGVRAAVVATDRLAPPPRRLPGARVRVGAGQPVPGLVRWCAAEGLAGVEFAEGIPARVGGAVRMNAGANRGTFGQAARIVLVAGPEGTVDEHRVTDDDFDYRTSFVARDGLFVVGAELALAEDDPEAIRERIRAFRARRRASQPLQERSAGCVFANWPDQSVGALVERLGLKGRRIGGAEVSTLHGNFIVNREQARAADVLALIDELREALLRETGLEPRLEVEIWRDA
ncbi:MAG: UDP-N-acetylmuramate dehydrogenase [Acidobacteria bacterium]|nr:MAG: UDP-N-acetylmuramate dehydrogenase [Acidobacteriota bacterium]